MIVNAQIIYNNAGKQVFTSKNDRKTLGNEMFISQSMVFQFIKVVYTQMVNWANGENNF